MTWAAALAIAHRAHSRLGVPWKIALYIAYAARQHKVRWALAYALFEQESDYKAIYGHDAGGLFPGREVTRDNYRRFREIVVSQGGRGANGVGLGQVTYWIYIKEHPGLWKKRVQVYLSLSILASYIHSLGEFKGIGAYNGGPNSPNDAYANEVLARAKRIRPKLARKGA